MNPQFSSYSNRGIQISLYISFVTSPVEIEYQTKLYVHPWNKTLGELKVMEFTVNTDFSVKLIM